jgi:hypothetical protein
VRTCLLQNLASAPIISAMRPRLLKSLRIAVTAVSLLVCGLLIVLWMRSYDYCDQILMSDGVNLKSVSSMQGEWIFYAGTDSSLRHGNGQLLHSVPSQYFREQSAPMLRYFKATKTSFSVPSWFFVTIFATIAALPWIKWRFSLRTLLIVMTLLALFFGAIAMSM